MNEPTGDDIRRTNMETLAASHVVYIEAVRNRYGNEGLAVIGEANRKHGLLLGKSAIKNGALKEGDLSSIFEFFKSAHPYFGFELELIRSEKNLLEIKVTHCPWLETFRKMNAGTDICDWTCKIDEGIGQAVKLDVHMTLPSCMMRGDAYCIYRWSL